MENYIYSLKTCLWFRNKFVRTHPQVFWCMIVFMVVCTCWAHVMCVTHVRMNYREVYMDQPWDAILQSSERTRYVFLLYIFVICQLLFVDNGFQAFNGSIDTFIKPGHDFKVCSGLFTNFHLPKSTLFVLVNAFVGIEKANELYSLAIKKRYRLFSYGDCCLLFP